VTAAVARGLISAWRHRIYLDILEELNTQRW
jgi:putative ribosome biogenesis GTPase RsgA